MAPGSFFSGFISTLISSTLGPRRSKFLCPTHASCVLFPGRSLGYDKGPELGSIPLDPEFVEPWLKILLYIGLQTGRLPEMIATASSIPDQSAPLTSDPKIVSH